MHPRSRRGIRRVVRAHAHKLWFDVLLYGRALGWVPVTVLMVLALHAQGGKADRSELKADRAALEIRQQREGRRVAIEVFCGVSQAVIDAGRAQILSSAAIGPPRFARNLERLGFPELRARQKTAELAAQAYSRGIARAVAREAGTHGLVNRDGRLRCDRLVSQAQAR
jgi:hypothetical protein